MPSHAVSPFPELARPTPADCRRVVKALAGPGGLPSEGSGALEADCGKVPSILEALVRTILSQNTTNKNSRAAMHALVRRYGDNWAAVLEAPTEDVAEALRPGGLANIKAKRIQAILRDIRAAHGEISLEHLRGRADSVIKETLLAYPGVGHKTVSCVLLFCLRRPSFAVDTHVHRIAGMMGWAPPGASRDATYHHLDVRVPDALKYDLHVFLVRHGQRCRSCRAQAQREAGPLPACPLSPFKEEARRKARGDEARPAARRRAS